MKDQRYAYINEASSLVENVILLPDGWPAVPNAFEPPEGYIVVQSDTAQIDDKYDAAAGTFSPNVSGATAS